MKKFSTAFLENQYKKLGDVSETVGRRTFGVRLPRSLEPRFIGEDGRNKTALLRQIIVRATAEFPEWVKAIEEELEENQPPK